MRPRLFWVNEIRRQWRDSSPVIDAGVEQLVIVRSREVGRRLNVYLWHQQTRDRDGAHHFTLRGLGPVAHGDLRLGAKVLNNHFLNMPIAAVQLTDGEQRVY